MVRHAFTRAASSPVLSPVAACERWYCRQCEAVKSYGVQERISICFLLLDLNLFLVAVLPHRRQAAPAHGGASAALTHILGQQRLVFRRAQPPLCDGFERIQLHFVRAGDGEVSHFPPCKLLLFRRIGWQDLESECKVSILPCGYALHKLGGGGGSDCSFFDDIP